MVHVQSRQFNTTGTKNTTMCYVYNEKPSYFYIHISLGIFFFKEITPTEQNMEFKQRIGSYSFHIPTRRIKFLRREIYRLQENELTRLLFLYMCVFAFIFMYPCLPDAFAISSTHTHTNTSALKSVIIYFFHNKLRKTLIIMSYVA